MNQTLKYTVLYSVHIYTYICISMRSSFWKGPSCPVTGWRRCVVGSHGQRGERSTQDWKKRCCHYVTMCLSLFCGWVKSNLSCVCLCDSWRWDLWILLTPHTAASSSRLRSSNITAWIHRHTRKLCSANCSWRWVQHAPCNTDRGRLWPLLLQIDASQEEDTVFTKSKEYSALLVHYTLIHLYITMCPLTSLHIEDSYTAMTRAGTTSLVSVSDQTL